MQQHAGRNMEWPTEMLDSVSPSKLQIYLPSTSINRIVNSPGISDHQISVSAVLTEFQLPRHLQLLDDTWTIAGESKKAKYLTIMNRGYEPHAFYHMFVGEIQ